MTAHDWRAPRDRRFAFATINRSASGTSDSYLICRMSKSRWHTHSRVDRELALHVEAVVPMRLLVFVRELGEYVTHQPSESKSNRIGSRVIGTVPVQF